MLYLGFIKNISITILHKLPQDLSYFSCIILFAIKIKEGYIMMEVSIEEMVEFIYDRCADDLTEEQIEMVLELQQEFLDSKGLIELEEDDIY